jgi:hypothetical protein
VRAFTSQRPHLTASRPHAVRRHHRLRARYEGGYDAFCAVFVGAKVDNALTKLQTLLGIHPQVGLHLLRVCCMPQLNYLAQVVPPSLTADHFSRFDAGVADLVL